MSEEYGNDFITLVDEEGKEFELEHIDTMEREGVVYMAFIPADTGENEEETDLIILRVVQQDGEELLATVDDDDLLQTLYELFLERILEDEEDDSPADGQD